MKGIHNVKHKSGLALSKIDTADLPKVQAFPGQTVGPFLQSRCQLGESVALQSAQQLSRAKATVFRQALGERFAVLKPLGLIWLPCDLPLVGAMFPGNPQLRAAAIQRIAHLL